MRGSRIFDFFRAGLKRAGWDWLEDIKGDPRHRKDRRSGRSEKRSARNKARRETKEEI